MWFFNNIVSLNRFLLKFQSKWNDQIVRDFSCKHFVVAKNLFFYFFSITWNLKTKTKKYPVMACCMAVKNVSVFIRCVSNVIWSIARHHHPMKKQSGKSNLINQMHGNGSDWPMMMTDVFLSLYNCCWLTNLKIFCEWLMIAWWP